MLVWMAAAAMVVLNHIPEATMATARNGFVSTVQRNGWFYYMVSGYAMNTTGEFNSTIAPSMCEFIAEKVNFSLPLCPLSHT